MKKIYIIFILSLIFFSSNNVFAECTGNLSNISYQNLDPDNIYAEGELVNTRLTFDLDGQSKKVGSDLALALVMDVSGSMCIPDCSKLNSAKTALKSVVQLLRDEKITNPSSKHEASLVPFNPSAWIEQSLTFKYDDLDTKINNMTAGLGTSIGGGLYVGADSLSPAKPKSKKIMILASDGEHNSGTSIATGMAHVSSDTTVYTVGMGLGADESTLKAIAENTGTKKGKYYYADTSTLESVLSSIVLKELEFEANNITFSLSRANLGNLDFSSANPAPIDPTANPLVWNLGNKKGTKNTITMDITYKVSSASQTNPIALNLPTIKVGYDSMDGDSCVLSEKVPVLKVRTFAKPVIVDFSSTPVGDGGSMDEGQDLFLEWNTQNAEYCEASGNDGLWIGQKESAETATKTEKVVPVYQAGLNPHQYTLKCFKNYGFIVAESLPSTINITVNACPYLHDSYKCDPKVDLNAQCNNSSCGLTLGDSYFSCMDIKRNCNGATQIDFVDISNCSPCTHKCATCKEVEEWIEVAP